MVRMMILMLGLFGVAPGWLAAAPYPGRIGVGIGLAEAGGSFVDVAKEAYGWHTLDGADLSATQVDEQGWPKVDAQFIIDWRPVAEWAGSIDDPEGYRIDRRGVYHGQFTGQANVTVAGSAAVSAQRYDAVANRTTFDLTIPPPGPQHAFFIISFAGTRRTPQSASGSGLTGFRLIRPGYPAQTAQLFTNEFIHALASARFGAIRFMEFRAANGSEPAYPATTEWARRKLPDDATQAPISQLGKLDGGSWEVLIELANAVHTDVWINIQLSASADYVHQLALLLRDKLDPALNIYVESSNEVWNTVFSQSQYNHAQAAALGLDDNQNHARRTVELAKAFRDVFGPDSLNRRVRVILASHAPMLKWWVQPMLEFIQAHEGPPRDYLYAIARQTYFGGEAASGKGEGTAGQLLDAAHADIVKQIGEEAGRKEWIALARQWQLAGGCCSYEGGPDYGGGSTQNLANRIMANRSPRMGREIQYNYDEGFLALGGTLAMQFTLSSPYTRYGCWGLTDDITRPDRNAKFPAIRRLLGSDAPTTAAH